MRRYLPLFAALLAVVAVGCAPSDQPRLYKVAIDVTPITTLDNPQCFKGNSPNTASVSQDSNYRREATWVEWDGPGAKQYLDLGDNTFTLADAPVIHVSDLIEGTQNTFSATHQEHRTSSIVELFSTVVVASLSDLGATPTGTLALTASYQCQNGTAPCPSEPNKRSCAVTLNFWARKLDVTQTANFSTTGVGITASAP